MVRTRKIVKGKYLVYLKKAMEFYESMKDAAAKGHWHSVGLAGVHCAISSCDALTTYYLGERCAGEKHEDILVLLQRIKIPEIQERIKQMSSILSVKNLVEYEDREFYEDDAQKIIKQVERLHLWVREKLPK